MRGTTLAVILTLILAGCLGTEQPPAPEVEIEGPSTGLVLEPLTFNGSASRATDGALEAYLWDFGDGKGATGPVVTHRYARPGSYSLRLVVTTDRGGANSDYHQVLIEEPNFPPVAVAGPDAQGVVGRNLTFDGSQSSDPEGPLTAYHWDFGDGNQAEGVVVNHSYVDQGSYTVTLTVTDQRNVTASDTLQVTVRLRYYQVRWDLHQGEVDVDDHLEEGQTDEEQFDLNFDNLTFIQANLTWTDDLVVNPFASSDDTFTLSASGPGSREANGTEDDGDVRVNFTASNLNPLPPNLNLFEARNLADLYARLEDKGHWASEGKGGWQVLIIMQEALPDPLIIFDPDLDTGNDFHLDFDYIYYTARVTEVTG